MSLELRRANGLAHLLGETPYGALIQYTLVNRSDELSGEAHGESAQDQ